MTSRKPRTPFAPAPLMQAVPYLSIRRTSAAAAALICFLCAAPGPVAVICEAGNSAGILGSSETSALHAALGQLNMTEADLGFEKDVGKPDHVLGFVRRMLNEPLALPTMSDRFRAAVESGSASSLWTLAHDSLELRPFVTTNVAPPSLTLAIPGGLDTTLAPALSAFVVHATAAERLWKDSFAGVTTDEVAYVMAAELAGLFDAEDQAETRATMVADGIASRFVERAVREGLDFDPAPAASNELGIVRRVDFRRAFAATRMLQSAADAVRDAALRAAKWPDTPARMVTPCGTIVIGSTGPDRYDERVLMVLDPGGDDVYAGTAASANGLAGASFSVVIDLGGNDLYAGDRLAGPGAALWGVCLIEDTAGDDTYRARYLGQAASILGVAWLTDLQGSDSYRARGHSQAAATHGVAVLRDAAGRDTYDVGMCGQGFAGVRGFGLLADDAGNDVYTAGGWKPDYERNDHRFLSLAQGFAIGMRPFAGGGVAALVDRAGNDTYVADVYGQGVSYWYSVGMLLDLDGHDSYSAFHYAQGSGIHLSLGLLADFAGNDTYTGSVLAQGNAHDYGVGMLFDKAGNDTYTADNDSQGRALYNGLALLVDSAGDDVYNGRNPDICQGIGFDGYRREYGCLGLLLDLGGRDRYSCGAQDRCSMLRPNFGIVYDAEPPARKNEAKK